MFFENENHQVKDLRNQLAMFDKDARSLQAEEIALAHAIGQMANGKHGYSLLFHGVITHDSDLMESVIKTNCHCMDPDYTNVIFRTCDEEGNTYLNWAILPPDS